MSQGDWTVFRLIDTTTSLRICTGAILLLLPFMISCQGLGVETGKLSGQVRFDPVSAEVEAYFAGVDVAPSCISYEPVHAYRVGSNLIAASTVYVPLSAPAFPLMANYELHPQVEENGTEFRVDLDSLCFGNGAVYRFGKIDPFTPGQFLSGVVLPESVDPAGATLDLVECAAVLHANVHLVGEEADIGGIAEPIECQAQANILENGVYQRQAISPWVSMDESEIKGIGAVLPIVVRGDGSKVSLTVTCNMNTTIPGFPVDVSLGVFQTSGEGNPVSVACGDSSTVVDVPIHIERTAGTLEGKIGFGGPIDFDFKVTLGPLRWTTDENVAQSGPPYLWRFDAVPAGRYGVEAEALIVPDKRVAVGFPHDTPPPFVEVEFEGETDLGSTFISQFAVVNGTVTLRDPRPSSPLSQLAFADLQQWDYDNWSSTVFEAVGIEGVYLCPEYPNCADGTGAYARVVPSGAFDSATGQAVLDYAFPIVGLSESGGPTDGSGAWPALWTMDRFDVFMGDPYGSYTKARFEPKFVEFYPSVIGEVYSVPDIDLCFGDIELHLVSASDQALYRPWLYVSDGIQTSSQDENGNVIQYRAVRPSYGYGEPRNVEDASSTVTVKATLPAFTQYEVRPRVGLVPPSGQSSTVYLDSILLPSDGGISCGGSTSECLVLEDGNPVSALRATIDTDSDYCQGDGLSIPVFAETGIGSIAYVDIKLDNQSAARLCTNCSSPFSATHSFGTVSAGSHTISVEAGDQFGCPPVGQTETIIVVEDATLICPDNVYRILAEGQDVLPYVEIEEEMKAEWSHACASNTSIGDDHPSNFPIGDTNVTFFPVDESGVQDMAQACTTKVMVKPPNGCSSFEGVPMGPVPTVWEHDRATYTDLSPTTTSMSGEIEPWPLRIKDEFPRRIRFAPDGDGIGELTVNGGVRIDLPFAAGWAEVQFYVGHPDPVIIEAFDQGGNLLTTFTSESDLDERKLHYAQISADGIAYLEMSGAGNEASIFKVCFCNTLCLPGDWGDNIIVMPG